MKNLFLFLATFLTFSAGFAQENAITKFFGAYQESEDFTKISVTGKMFSLFTELDSENEDEKAILEAISKLKGIRGLIRKDAENGNKMYFDAIKKMSTDGQYEELMTVEDVKENVRFMIKDENGKISELLMLRGAEREFMVMTLFGEIDLSTISRISKVMRVHGMDKFGMIDGHGKEHDHKDEKH